MKLSGISKYHIIQLGLVLLVLIGTFVGILAPDQDTLWVQTLRIVCGSIFILFLPGYFLTRIFFQGDEIDVLERFALSFALSISVVPLLTFYLNLVGMKITAVNVALLTTAIILISVLTLLFYRNKPAGK